MTILTYTEVLKGDSLLDPKVVRLRLYVRINNGTKKHYRREDLIWVGVLHRLYLVVVFYCVHLGLLTREGLSFGSCSTSEGGKEAPSCVKEWNYSRGPPTVTVGHTTRALLVYGSERETSCRTDRTTVVVRLDSWSKDELSCGTSIVITLP